MPEITVKTIEELQQAESALTKDARELIEEWDKPLIVENGRIVQGVYFLNCDFVSDFWSGRRKKPKAAKCTCQCGNRHNLKT
jgi:hypothetical protein